MKIAITGAFIFLMSVSTLFYLSAQHDLKSVFVAPFLISILLVPYGLNKDDIK